MKLILFALVLSFSATYSNASAENTWNLEKDKNGIKVWTRKSQDSNLKEFKGTTILYITTENLIAFIKNYKLFDKWMYKVNEGSVRLVKKITDNDYYVLMTMSAPFIKSRESITHFRFNAPDTKGAILINLDAAPNLLPLNDNYIRIPRMEAFFKLVPLGNGKIEFTHFASSSPGGSIPDAIANWGAVDAPYYMLEKLKELLK